MSRPLNQKKEFFEERNKFDLKQLVLMMRVNWRWFLFSMIVCLLFSVLYLRYTAPVYQTISKVLITEDKAPNPADDALSKAFGGSFGMGNGGEAEAEIFKTMYLMRKVVHDMKAYITYFHKGNVMSVELYKTAPFKLTLLSSPDSIYPQKMELSFSGNKIEINGEIKDTDEEYSKSVSLYQQFTIPHLGKVQIERGFGKPVPEQTYTVEIETVTRTVQKFMKKMEIDLPIPMVKVIAFDYSDAVPGKSEDILNKLTEAYIETALNDKNKIADSTIAFIENRLIYVGRELGDIEGNVQSFKQRNKLTDISAQSTELISSTKESVKELGKVETQINVLDAIEQDLTKSGAGDKIVPSGALLDDDSFASLIERYNSIVLEKERSSLTQTEANPYMQNLNVQIASAKSDMLSSLRSIRNSLNITKNRARSQSNTIAGQVKDVPEVERIYFDLSRQQQIKQDLYVFLLQKREETAISKKSNISNCRLIEPPISFGPTSPLKPNVVGYAIVLGLLFPFGFIILRDKISTRVISKDQILNHTMTPIIGEIGHSLSNETIVVSNDSRKPIAEQFRALRTNLTFFLKENDKKILMTSSMSGEGKSFISLNLATVLAISGKKVVLMEMDLRRPNLSNKVNLKNDFGFTNYIVSSNMLPEKIIMPSGLHDNLQIISSGNIPPNPSEIILNERTDVLMSYLYDNYDYVIIDAPPIGLVTDAQLLSKHADLTLYVVRQQFTDVSQLSIPQDIYSNQKMKNIAILVNDVKRNHAYGSGGYSYGYGYDSFEESKKTGFFKGLFKN